MRDAIEAAFPQTRSNNCLQTLIAEVVTILDTEQARSIVQTDPEGPYDFTVENPTCRKIHFLAIDKCLFMDVPGEPRRCDFAVFDTKTFCFVEIKDGVHTKDAKEQLKITIRLFREKMTFTTRFVEAHLCVRGSVKPRPARLVQDIIAEAEFAELNVKLYHGNSKRFA
jgi:hypothetical protein